MCVCLGAKLCPLLYIIESEDRNKVTFLEQNSILFQTNVRQSKIFYVMSVALQARKRNAIEAF